MRTCRSKLAYRAAATSGRGRIRPQSCRNGAATPTGVGTRTSFIDTLRLPSVARQHLSRIFVIGWAGQDKGASVSALLMHYSNRSALSILLTLTAAGCADTSSEPDAQVAPRVGLYDNPLCLDSLAIGRTSDAACPKATNWTENELFAFTGTDGVGGTVTERWCRYEAGASAGLSAFDDLDLEDMSQECIGVFAQTNLEASMAPHLAESFRERIGDVKLEQLDLPSGGSANTSRADTIVGVIDTTPGWEGWKQSDANSMHGVHMARIIDDIACPDSDSCNVITESYLGLPRTPTGIDTVKGGFGGTHGDFAAAIVEAVDNWKNNHGGLDDVSGPNDLADRKPLILNLSAGWETDLVGLSGGNEPGRVLAVRSALEYASCHGALILAAVGNDAGHCTDGPLAPALWEENTAPSQARCIELGLDTNVGGLPDRPLVYGVTGLGAVNELMPGTRPLSNARIAAPASYVVALSDVDYTVPLTGTSVAAAAASGVASLVWSFAPSLTPGEVMGLLYNSGEPLTLDADTHHHPTTAPKVHRINACDAVQLACDESPTCAFNLGCTPGDGAPGLAAAFDLATNAVPDTPSTVATLPPFEHCPQVCGAYDATSPGDACADTASDPLAAYVFPQPPDPPCPVCTLSGDVLTGSRHSAYSQDTIEKIILILKGDDSLDVIDLTDSFDLQTAGVSRVQIPNLDLASFTGTARIQVEFSQYPKPVSNAVGRRSVGAL